MQEKYKDKGQNFKCKDLHSGIHLRSANGY